MDDLTGKKQRFLGLMREGWFTVFIILLIAIAWEWGVSVGWVSFLFFPPPSVIISTFIKLIANHKLTDNTGITLWRVFLGLILGGIPGLILGLILGWSHRLYRLVNPLIAATHPIPKIAILPLIMIIFGIGESSKVVVIALTAFFPLLINTAAGVQQINPIHFEVAKNYGANLTKIFTRVIFPGSLPLILTGLRLSLNLALLVSIAVELVSAQKGLGAMIWLAWQTLRTEELYVSLVMTALLGVFFNFFLQRIAIHLVPWKTEQRI
ncbi:MAG: ABC transporter permease [Syntrophaceae bacterium]|nr:ABC transporter permease [Syntrophaceae bacterium]